MITYDAFVSYSQSADAGLAYSIQRSLQRLGKKWYQLRAIRVFRDETSLSATPELWSSLERAMEDSRYLILIASPEAADSPWVNKEVKWWLENKGADTLLIALSDGELNWDVKLGCFDRSRSSAAPKSLISGVSSEPLWVDFRKWRGSSKANTDESFLQQVAAFSSSIQGKPKEDILSDELRNRRRTFRVAVGGVVTIAALTILGVFSVLETRRQQEAADAQRTEAAIRKSAELAALAATAASEGDGLRSSILTLNALPKDLSDVNSYAPGALSGLVLHPRLLNLRSKNRTPRGLIGPLAISMEEGWYAVGGQEEVEFFDLESHRRSHVLDLGAQNSVTIAWSDVVQLLAANVYDDDQEEQFLALLEKDGSIRCKLRLSSFAGALRFTPDGNVLIVGEHNGLARKFRTSDCKRLAFYRGVNQQARDIAIFQSEHGTWNYAIAYNGGALVLLDDQLNEIGRKDGQFPLLAVAASADEAWIARSREAGFVEVIPKTGEVLQLEAGGATVFDLETSPTGRFLAASSGENGVITIWDTKDWLQVGRIELGTNSGAGFVRFVSDERLFAFEALLGDLYDLSIPISHGEIDLGDVDYFSVSILGVNAEDDENVRFLGTRSDEEPEYWIAEFGDGEVARRVKKSALTIRNATINYRYLDRAFDVLWADGRSETVDVGAPIYRLEVSASENFLVIGVDPEDDLSRAIVMEIRDGKFNQLWDRELSLGEGTAEFTLSPASDIAAFRRDSVSLAIVDLSSGEEISTLDGPLSHLTDAAFSVDGKFVGATSYDGRARLWDTSTGELVTETARQSSQLFGVAISPDNDLIAAAGYDGAVRVFHSQTGTLLANLDTGSLRTTSSVDFSPSGRWVFAAAGGRYIYRFPVGRVTQGARDLLELTMTIPPKNVSFGGALPDITSYRARCQSAIDALDSPGVIPSGGVIGTPSFSGAIRVCKLAVLELGAEPCMRFGLSQLLREEGRANEAQVEMQTAIDEGCKEAELARALSLANDTTGVSRPREGLTQARGVVGDVAEILAIRKKLLDSRDSFAQLAFLNQARELDHGGSPVALISLGEMIEVVSQGDESDLMEALEFYDKALQSIERDTATILLQDGFEEFAWRRRSAIASELGPEITLSVIGKSRLAD